MKLLLMVVTLGLMITTICLRWERMVRTTPMMMVNGL
uniref:Uncharacterized protein n=1 Tax=Arundo donax TaxID=35708 RepID=A0A0A9CEB1_ARUDO